MRRRLVLLALAAAAAGLRLGRAVRIAERGAGRPAPVQTSRDAAQPRSAPPIAYHLSALSS